MRWIRERVGVVIQGVTAGEDAFTRAAGSPADVILIDGPQPGSGTVFDWSLAEGAPPGVKILLAGGLSPENVTAAIQKVRPWGVDVASGVETAPGPEGSREGAPVHRGGQAGGRGARPTTAGIRRQTPERPFDWAEDDR